jgi:hypothetical protein
MAHHQSSNIFKGAQAELGLKITVPKLELGNE